MLVYYNILSMIKLNLMYLNFIYLKMNLVNFIADHNDIRGKGEITREFYKFSRKINSISLNERHKS